MPLSTKLKITVGARSSPLSQVQLMEVWEELRLSHPHVVFEPILFSTTGDKDQVTSLRTLDKTNFFTKEIDDAQLSLQCRLSIHSAKDLPHPLPKGLVLAALTQGVDSSDSLVIPQNYTLETLPKQALIATSSARREEAVKQLRPDFAFCDIRGTIGQRLAQMESGKVHGVVIAEAAIIRLKLTHLNRIKLPGKTTDYQGRLAVLAREDDLEMRELLQCLNKSPQILYLGLEPPPGVIHCPLIKIVPKQKSDNAIVEGLKQLPEYTHLLFTSKSSVDIFFEYLDNPSILKDKEIVALGRATASRLSSYGVQPTIVAATETSEGVVEVLQQRELKNPYFFWPHSSLSRPVIKKFFQDHSYRHYECIFYDTINNRPSFLPSLDTIDEIIFTSPSTVDSFIEIFGPLPLNKILTPIGPITAERINFVKR